MGDTIECSECGAVIESADDLETDRAIPEVETDDGEFHLFENRDLYRCRNCKNPLGVGRSDRSA